MGMELLFEVMRRKHKIELHEIATLFYTWNVLYFKHDVLVLPSESPFETPSLPPRGSGKVADTLPFPDSTFTGYVVDVVLPSYKL